MRIVRICRYRSSMSSAALEERAQDSMQEGRVDFALFNIPHIAKSLMPVDNEPKHGACAEPFRRYLAKTVDIDEEKKRFQLRSLRLPDGRNALTDYTYRRPQPTSILFLAHF
jgi:hypothetical protein